MSFPLSFSKAGFLLLLLRSLAECQGGWYALAMYKGTGPARGCVDSVPFLLLQAGWEPCSITCFPIKAENKTEDSISCPLCVPWRRWLMAINNTSSTDIKLLDGNRKVGQPEVVLPWRRNLGIAYCCLFLHDPVVAWKCMKQREACLLASFGWLLKIRSHFTCGSRAGEGICKWLVSF